MWNSACQLGCAICASVLVLNSMGLAHSQVPQLFQPTVQAYGEHVLELQPQKVRLLLMAKAEGANAKEAVEQLSRHRQTVRDELVALKADRDSIKVAPAEIRSHIMGLPKQYQHMSHRMLTTFLDSSTNINVEDLPIVYTASCIVAADWTLPNADPDLLLQLPNTLREQIAERDLMGDDNQLQLSPEQAARVEKFKAAVDEHVGFYEDDDSAARLQIVYVARVEKDARSVALKTAYERAREECNALAEASGHTLARMSSLSKVTPDESSNSFVYTGSSGEGTETLLTRQSLATRRDEFTARHPDLLTARFQVRVIFTVAKD